MAGERLNIETLDGDHKYTIEVQGNLQGAGWVGTSVDGFGPASSWGPGEIEVIVTDPASHKDMKATAEVSVVGGRIVLTGVSGFRW